MLVFKFYERRLDPNTPAPSVRRAMDAKEKAVAKAKSKLEQAEMKALQKAESIAANIAKKAMKQATKDAKANAKARAQAKGKAGKAMSPVPVHDMEETEIKTAGTNVTSNVKLGFLSCAKLKILYYAAVVGVPAVSKTEEHIRRIIQEEHMRQDTLKPEHIEALMTSRNQNFLFISDLYKTQTLEENDNEGELRYIPSRGTIVDSKGKTLNMKPVEAGKSSQQTMAEAECYLMSDDNSDFSDEEFLHPDDV